MSKKSAIILPGEAGGGTLSLFNDGEKLLKWFPRVDRDEKSFWKVVEKGYTEGYLGLDFEFPPSYKASVIGVASKGHACAIPASSEIVRKVVEGARQSGTKLVGHSVIGAEKKVVEVTTGIIQALDEYDDTMLRHYLLNSDLCKSPDKGEDDDAGALGFMGLWTAASLYLLWPAWKDCRGTDCEQVICPRHDVLGYCAVDAAASLEINYRQKDDMARWKVPEKLYLELKELTHIAQQMQDQGVKVNIPYVKEMEAKAGKYKAELFPPGGDFNPRAPEQVVKWFRSQGLEIGGNDKKSIRKALEKTAVKYGFSTYGPDGKFTLDEIEAQDTLPKELDALYRLHEFKGAGKGLDSWFGKKYLDPDSYIHPRFITIGASTSRWCVAAGTKIEILRDVEKYPKGINIEDVKMGDIAYSYDGNRNLAIKKVLWAGKTGTKKVLRIHWMGGGRHTRGYLDVTPEHEIRLVDGRYVPAKDLKPGMRTLALARGIDAYGYGRLYITGEGERKEHRKIAELLGLNIESKEVHHKDENKLNNIPENFQIMTGEEHKKLHLTRSPEVKGAISTTLKKLRVEKPDRWKNAARRGKDHPDWLGLSKEWILEKIKEHKKLTCFRDIYDLDYATVQKYMKMHGITGMEEKHKAIADNHIITKIEELREEVDVYDLEIEDTHNFIANEICVHNSSSRPNFTNIPARGFGSLAKGAIIPRDESLDIVTADSSNLELRDVIYLSGFDPSVIIPGDPFKQLVIDAQGAFDNVAKINNDTPRGVAKTVSHAFSYLEGIKVLYPRDLVKPYIKQQIEAGALKVYKDWNYRGGVVAFTGANLSERIFGDKSYANRKLALEISEIYSNRLPMIRQWHRKILAEIEEKRFVQYPTGHFLRLYGSPEDDAKMGAAALGQGVGAHYVQGIVLRFYREQGRIPLLFIHDSLAFEIPREWSDDKARQFISLMGEETDRLPGFKCPYKAARGDNALEKTMRPL